ncbi:fengycin family lipopeptide synthetase D [Kordia periserrulae]|uniref:Fengycin family lipopeptide synthetase D n=1 Tax=Kordia periserrulae TaxID=701523 RepID=A0A2T6BZ69_9FLAO|nr:non-ribosomal peptide synthetase [Kordia periserrulae]PTX61363.1 fengycin family lipopeptide synthetase D [Kordia periserrulae]
MPTIERKLVSDYWIQKLKKQTVSAKEQFQLETTEKLLIPNENISYFLKITNEKPIVEYTILLSIYSAMLQRYFEPSHFIFSTKVQDAETPLLLHHILIEKKNFKEYLNETKLEIQEVYKYASFEKDAVLPQKFKNYSPFGFSYNTSVEQNEIPFFLEINKEVKGITLAIRFAESFKKSHVVTHFLKNFQTCLENLESNLEKIICDISITTREEEDIILKAFNDTNYDFPLEESIIDLFEKQVEKTPNNTALVFQEKSYTYKELNEEANALAHYLVDERNIQVNDFVGVKLERTELLVISLLAVLKTGAAYVPIDKSYPAERIQYIENDSQCKLVIEEELDFFNNNKQYATENLGIQKDAHDLAYIIYTSGTTGKPKGVMITHQNAVAMIYWAHHEFANTGHEVTFAVTSHCFDLSVYEIFYTLSTGKRIRLLQNSLDIGTYILEDKNILINTVPSSMRNLLEKGYSLENVVAVNLAGEPFPVDIAMKLLADSDAEIRNLYGPSEDTTYSTYYQLEEGIRYNSIPVGKPLLNTQAFILDENLAVVPIGVPGKLYLSGLGVTKGYLNREELTAEKYIPNPYLEGERMYDTGDLAYWMPDGNIGFLGRKDHQVKLRGYRIELGEIENEMLDFTDAIQRVVVAVKLVNKQQVLVGYYVGDKGVDKSGLRAHLLAKLPSYMVPTYFVHIKDIPLTPNGKINRDALPEISTDNIIKAEYVAPRNDVEEQLKEIWEKIIGVDTIGIKDNFFELGGHSLMISQVINTMYKEMGKSVSFKTFSVNPTIENLSAELNEKQYEAIPVAAEATSYPLTPAQHRLWLLSQLEGGTNAYQITGAYHFKGNLDDEIFINAFTNVVKRHESLRTYFKENEHGIPQQYIVPFEAIDVSIAQIDFSQKEQPETFIDAYIDDLLSEGFNLATTPLFKAALIKKTATETIFVVAIHHIIGDGWSLEIFTNEIIDNYLQASKGITSDKASLDIQFKDYAVWLQQSQTVERLEASKAFWLQQFSGELPVLQLPQSRKRPVIKTYSGSQIRYTYSREHLTKLKNFSKEHQVTLFMTIMAAVKALLHKYSNADDIILGTPIAGREHPDLENQIGLYLNTLAIRTQIQHDETLASLLEKEKAQLLNAYTHQEYPFDQLVEQLGLKRDTSRSPLFDVMVALQNQQQLGNFKEQSLGELTVDAYEIERTAAQFDITYTFVEVDEELFLEVQYNTDVYDTTFIKSSCEHLELIFEQYLEDATQKINSIDITSPEEKVQLLEAFQGKEVPVAENANVLSLFAEQVVKNGQNTSITVEETNVSYHELNAQSDRLAVHIQNTTAIVKGAIIAVQLDRGIDYITSLLAIMKLGATYLPIDTNYPENRISYMIQDAGAVLVIDTNFIESYHNASIDTGGFTAATLGGNDIAYVIYTSGSTGKPKGVPISQRSLVNLCQWHQAAYGVTSESRATLFSGIAFDASVWEIFPYLTKGATLFPITSKEVRLDIFKFKNFLNHNKITHAYVPSRICQELVANDVDDVSTILLTGGEALSFNKTTSLHIYNNYGPTENTVVTTFHKYTNSEKGNIAIGKPVDNTKVYVLSDELTLQPIGVVGELCIAGIGLSEGYLHQEALTNTVFVKNPFNSEEKLYKTGDLVRWLPNGTLEFSGRKDTQIKIRGHRIELGEIEQAITDFAEIKEAVVLVKIVQKEKVLVAYYIAENEINTATFKERLLAEMPSYMIPQYYIPIDAIPLTPNGKVAVAQLPEISETHSIQATYIAPRTETEEMLVTIWKDFFNKEKISVLDDFFELGGHSLILTKLINAYHKVFNVRLSLEDVYVKTSLESHAILLDSGTKVQYEEIEKIAEQEVYELSPTQVRFWLIHKIQGASKEFNISNIFDLEKETDIDVLEAAFNEILQRHEILRTVFVDAIEAPKQRIEAFQPTTIKRYDTVETITNEVIQHEFDLESYPLFKIGTLTNGEETKLYFNIHHSICDGWSMQIIIKELLTIYQAKLEKATAALPALTIDYKDYAAWQNKALQTETLAAQGNYWKQQLSGNIPYLELPRDYNTAIKSNQTISGYHTIFISNEIKEKITAFTAKHSVSPFAFYLTAIKVLLQRLTAENDITVGIPAANRNHEQLKNIVGCFLNTLMIRDEMDASADFTTILQKVNTTLIAALANQNYPFEQLLDDLDITAEDKRFPISPVFLNMLDFEAETTAKIQDFTAQTGTIEASPKFDLEWYIQSFENGYMLKSVFNSELFSKETITYWTNELLQLIQQVVENTAIHISEIDIFNTNIEIATDAMPTNAFEVFEASEIEQNVTARFEKQVSKYPNAIAVHAKNKAVSYAELNAHANHVAHQILAEATAATQRIALLLDHDETCVIGMLGTLKAGYSYVPIDVNNPNSRITFILEDASANILVCNQRTLQKAQEVQADYPAVKLICLPEEVTEIENPNKTIAPSTEAYVLYTSGSTGKPKGVVQTQRNMLHYIRVYTNNVHISNQDNLSVFSTYTFDASIKDIYGAILNGATVSFYNIAAEGVANIQNWLATQKISIIHMVPTLYRYFIKELEPSSILHTVRLLDSGGEASYKSDLELFKKHFPKGAFLVNDYGPTEATIISQKFLSHDSAWHRTNLSLGKPVVDTEVYIWDENNTEVGMYQEGEIVFKSDYISLGYLNRPELTEKAFLTDEKGHRYYKSGDIGRRLSNGEIEFLHRKDSQVKLNGVRIELPEIEYQLEQLPSIKKAIVLVTEVEEIKFLTAYLEKTENIEADALKQQLRNQLPKYMIPSIYMFIEAFPLTRTGKIDRKALPQPTMADLKKTPYKAPQSDMEFRMVELWADILKIAASTIGVNDNFFELGGHSLSMNKMLNQLKTTYKVNFNYEEFYAQPTIAYLVVHIENVLATQMDTTQTVNKKIII